MVGWLLLLVVAAGGVALVSVGCRVLLVCFLFFLCWFACVVIPFVFGWSFLCVPVSKRSGFSALSGFHPPFVSHFVGQLAG